MCNGKPMITAVSLNSKGKGALVKPSLAVCC